MQEMQERQVWSLGREDPLEEEMATCSSILAWKIPWTDEPGGLQSTMLQSRTWLSVHTHKRESSWRDEWGIVNAQRGTGHIFTVSKIQKQLKCSSINGWRSEDYVIYVCIYTYAGVCVYICTVSFLFPVEERIKSGICSSMDEPWGHYTKGINHTEKDNLYNIIYMWYLQ